jgi:hypothetical protein
MAFPNGACIKKKPQGARFRVIDRFGHEVGGFEKNCDAKRCAGAWRPTAWDLIWQADGDFPDSWNPAR